jgi:hypothetical protein
MKNKIRKWSEAELVDTFSLNKTKFTAPLLVEWLAVSPIDFNEMELTTIHRILAEAQENIEAWNEEDLKMNFIAFVIDLAGLKSTKYIRTFFEKTVEATVQGYFLKTKTDFMIATGVLDLVKVPYFHFQEYKREKDPTGDPMAQLIEAFLIAQEKNKNGKPLYGCYVVGKFWYFTTMEGKEYCVSNAFDATDKQDLCSIIAVLRKFRVILQTRLLDSQIQVVNAT